MLSILRQIASLQSVRSVRVWTGGVLTLLLVIMAGCGSGSTSSGGGAKATPITMTSASGVTASASYLSIGSKISLNMTPTSDAHGLGVDWTVACGGNPTTGSLTNGACGTFSPAHTQDGSSTLYTAPSAVPVYTTVTITATVTSDRSQSSTLSITIVASPVGVSFDPNVVLPTSTPINTTKGFNAQVTNDPLNSGVIWTVSCGSSVCGSFNPATTPSLERSVYTAPSVVPTGGTVTITATSLTDTSKSISTPLAITVPPPPVPVTVNVVPSKVYLETTGSTHSVQLTPVVTDPTGAGVDWTLSCGASSCGTINGSIKAHSGDGVAVTYVSPSNAPSGLTVTITATSTANKAVSASSTATVVTTLPIVVTMSPAPPATLTAGTQTTLSAKTANDAGNFGVDWTATCSNAGACGSFSLTPAHTASGGQIVYTAPASVPTGGLVTITATSSASTPANPAVAFTTIVAPLPALTFKQSPPSSMVAVTQASVSATVANDVAPGGVTWSVQCSNTVAGACGWISPVQTASGATAIYTAPPATSPGTVVTITATSVADPSISISSYPITICPSKDVSISFIPSLPAQIQPNASVNLVAAVNNDKTNAGVDWKVCESGCGFFTIKPAIAAIPATATTPPVPAVPAVTSTTTNTQLSPYWPNGWPSDLPLPYTAPTDAPVTGLVAVVATSHADTTQAISGTIAVNTQIGGPALNGTVNAGTKPVAGATVLLFAAGTSGYASASSQLALTTTDKNGSFTMPAGYTCPSPASETYLVATGGSVGANTNPNLSLMTALGSCNALSSSGVVINEITTVASAWSTAVFASDDALTGNSSYLYLGTSSGNLIGLANAFAMVNNLVDITTGKPRFVTPAGNAVVPYAEINMLADYLNACTATSGGVEGDGSPCSVLFVAADTLTTGILSGAIGPSDTLQVAFNIAQHPRVGTAGHGVGNASGNDGPAYDFDRDSNIYTLATSASPFQPAIFVQSPLCSLSLNYTAIGGGFTDASTVGSLAIDASGNLWITDTTAGSVIEWNAVGAAISPSTGFPAGGGPLAIDANGNVWVSGNGFLSELTELGTPVPGSPFGGVAGGGSDISIDAQQNIWIANGAGVNEFDNFGVAQSPPSGFINSGLTGITAVGIDSSNNAWIGSTNTGGFYSAALSVLGNPGGVLIATSENVPEASIAPQLAADSAGDIWAVSGDQTLANASSLCKFAPYGGQGTILLPACVYSTADPNGSMWAPVPAHMQGLAMDGAGGLWVSDPGGVMTVRDALGNFNGAGNSIPVTGVGGSLRVGVDGSGNVWALLANNIVVEHISTAPPVVTPIALGAKNKKLAAKP